jgi:hypothetical protein
MKRATEDIWGVLVIRAWRDELAGAHLRARIITTVDPPYGGSEIDVASGVEEILLNVRKWLENLEGERRPQSARF